MMERARALVDGATSRGAIKAAGKAVDDGGEPLKRAVIALAMSRGIELDDDAITWPGKKLVRFARGRSDASQVRTNPIHRDEAFLCVACGKQVPPHGRSARDHCPHCLVGLHVDAITPGDRASTCGGILRPVRAEQLKGRWLLRYVCASCGATRVNQVLEDGDPPDHWPAVIALASAP